MVPNTFMAYWMSSGSVLVIPMRALGTVTLTGALRSTLSDSSPHRLRFLFLGAVPEKKASKLKKFSLKEERTACTFPPVHAVVFLTSGYHSLKLLKGKVHKSKDTIKFQIKMCRRNGSTSAVCLQL